MGSVGTRIAGLGRRASKAMVPPFPVAGRGGLPKRPPQKPGLLSERDWRVGARVCFLRTKIREFWGGGRGGSMGQNTKGIMVRRLREKKEGRFTVTLTKYLPKYQICGEEGGKGGGTLCRRLRCRRGRVGGFVLRGREDGRQLLESCVLCGNFALRGQREEVDKNCLRGDVVGRGTSMIQLVM